MNDHKAFTQFHIDWHLRNPDTECGEAQYKLMVHSFYAGRKASA